MCSGSRVPREHWSQCVLSQPVVAQGPRRRHTAGRASEGPGSARGTQGGQGEAGDSGSGQKNSRCVFHTHAVKCPVRSLTKGLAPPSAGPSAFPRLAPRPPSLASGDAPSLVHSINVARPGPRAGPGRGWAGRQLRSDGPGAGSSGPEEGGRWLSWGSEEGRPRTLRLPSGAWSCPRAASREGESAPEGRCQEGSAAPRTLCPGVTRVSGASCTSSIGSRLVVRSLCPQSLGTPGPAIPAVCHHLAQWGSPWEAPPKTPAAPGALPSLLGVQCFSFRASVACFNPSVVGALLVPCC